MEVIVCQVYQLNQNFILIIDRQITSQQACRGPYSEWSQVQDNQVYLYKTST